MKHIKILRIFSLSIIMALLVMAAPVAAQSRSIDIDPEEGTIGSTVEIVGEGFNAVLKLLIDMRLYFSRVTKHQPLMI